MGGGVGIPADDGHSREGQSPLRADDVDDTVARVHHPEMLQPELLGIRLQSLDLTAGNRVFDFLVLVVGRGIVVRHAENPFRTQRADAPAAKAVKCLRAGHFVAVESVDIELDWTVVDCVHDMRVPDFIK